MPIVCKSSNTFREIIVKYLRESNSKMIYSPESISFIYFAKILNGDKYINKSLAKVLKKVDLQSKMFTIRIIETEDIIGALY